MVLRLRKRMIISFLLVMGVLIFSGIPAQAAKRYSENGTWKRKIGKTTWYFDVNDYTSGTPDDDPNAKYYGVVYIYKGKKNYQKHKYVLNAEYYKISTNKYAIKYKGGKITFTVKAKSIVLKQNKGRVKGTKLKGKFKLLRRHYS